MYHVKAGRFATVVSEEVNVLSAVEMTFAKNIIAESTAVTSVGETPSANMILCGQRVFYVKVVQHVDIGYKNEHVKYVMKLDIFQIWSEMPPNAR